MPVSRKVRLDVSVLVAGPEIHASQRPEPNPQSLWARSSFREIAMWLLDLMIPLPALVGSLSLPTSNLFTD